MDVGNYNDVTTFTSSKSFVGGWYKEHRVQENTVLGRTGQASITIFAITRGPYFRGVTIAKGITWYYINNNVNRMTR